MDFLKKIPVWGWIVIAVVVLGLIGMATDAGSTETENGQEKVQVSEQEKKPETTLEKQPAGDTGVSPEFKEMMDSYEKFFTEYCEIAKKTKENPNDIAITMKFGEMMLEYANMLSNLEALENEDLNDAEMAYYLQVNGRITEMLLEVAK